LFLKKGRFSVYHGVKRALIIASAALAGWFSIQFCLPLAFPFLLGLGLALAAEPLTGLLCGRLKLRRGPAAGIGVTAALCFLSLLFLLLCALVLRELGLLMQILPQLEQAATGGLSALSAWALDLAGRLPGNMGDLVSRSVTDFFSGGSRLLEQGFRYALSLTGGILSRVPNGALIFGTALISGYMISARLPEIRAWFRKKLTLQRPQKILEGLCRIKTALLGWLKAQLKLMGITWAILTLGLVLLRIPYAPVWAAAVALVDAFPILGTGTILLPWALVSFLQADTARAVGLLGTHALISLTRSVLEPKLLGSQMGLDPLVTLISLYSGYRLWGFGGMILAPVLAVAAVQLLREPSG
jgi:sporulation integral membrane protein YtvI